MKHSYSRMGKYLFALIAFFLCLPLAAQDVTTGIVLNYDFESVSGTTVPDVSGNNLAGTLVGAPTVAAGQSGNGVYFPLKTDYMTLPTGVVSTLSSYTISVWVNLTTINTWSRIFDFGTGTSNYMFLTPRISATGGARFAIKNGGAEQQITATSAVPVGAWTNVVLTYDAITTTGKLYINGVLAGTNSAMTINPSLLPSTTLNYIGKSQFSGDPKLDGTVDDIRIYNRTLTANDVLALTGLAELKKQADALTLGDLSAVTSNLTLPTTAGTQGVTIRWASSKPSVIDTLGHMTQPAKYDAKVTLTATLSQTVGGKTYSVTKTFVATVPGIIPTPLEIADWTFADDNVSIVGDTTFVTDTKSGFKGKLMNEAKLRTIGKPDVKQFKVLYLGNGTGYFDMGQDIGQAIYSLSDHTIMGYFRVDADYTNLGAGGNYYWNFGNSNNIGSNPIGFMYGRLSATAAGISAAGSPSTATSAGKVADKGTWHHFAYTLKNDTGTVYVDGVQVAQNPKMLIPSNTLVRDGLAGTLYNYLGRSSWTSDAYLKKTLLYDFRVMSAAVSPDDINFGFDGFDAVNATIDELNTAYASDSNYVNPALVAEMNNLSLGDLSAVTGNLTLPTGGTLDPTISISWASTLPAYIGSTGVVTRPNYYNANVTLTATLKLGKEIMAKTFPATVVVAPGSEFTGDLIAKYDFSNVNGNIVTDAAEKHFTGTLMNNATIKTIGDDISGKYKVLSLGDSIGYFDMGTEIGKVMPHLTDYTISAYYRVDTAYTKINAAGNYLWNFSNSNNAGTDKNGYMMATLNVQGAFITPSYYGSGNQSVSYATVASKGAWHHLAYTQSGTTGTLYIDGMPMLNGTVTNLPTNSLLKDGLVGTPYNWIGRSCFTSDNYLRKTLVYDFRVYKKALTDSEVATDELNVVNTIAQLDAATLAGVSAGIKAVTVSPYRVVVEGKTIKLTGLKGDEKVSLYDICGRQLKASSNTTEFTVCEGIYIVKINGFTQKVLVK